MNKFNVILLIVLIVVIIIGICFILYKLLLDKIVIFNNKLLDSKKDYQDKLKEKHNLVLELINIIETKYKIESKTLNNLKKVKEDNIITDENENLLNKCYKEIIDIKEDHKKQRETKAFKALLNDYEETDLYLVSLRTYYNKYTLMFNSLIKKFPYNIISIFKKFKTVELIEGKELDDNFNNDLEV